MNWLQTIARRVGESPDDWLAKAEAIGEVTLSSNHQGGKRAEIAIGSYWDVRLQVWAVGDTNSAALRAVVEKATPIIATMLEASTNA